MLNNVKSIKILNIILGALKKRIELELFKYNKKMTKKLNITKEDFEQFAFLKEMNLKFKLNIKDIDINELNLGNKNLDNDIIELLGKIKFNKLKFSNLWKNYISDIKGIEKAKFEKLEILNLSENYISNIDNILEKDNFKELKKLHLYKNRISDIKVLENIKFEKIEIFNFKELKRLSLNKNYISNIKILKKVKFEKLELLSLSENRISNIDN